MSGTLQVVLACGLCVRFMQGKEQGIFYYVRPVSVHVAHVVSLCVSCCLTLCFMLFHVVSLCVSCCLTLFFMLFHVVSLCGSCHDKRRERE